MKQGKRQLLYEAITEKGNHVMLSYKGKNNQIHRETEVAYHGTTYQFRTYNSYNNKSYKGIQRTCLLTDLKLQFQGRRREHTPKGMASRQRTIYITLVGKQL